MNLKFWKSKLEFLPPSQIKRTNFLGETIYEEVLRDRWVSLPDYKRVTDEDLIESLIVLKHIKDRENTATKK